MIYHSISEPNIFQSHRLVCGARIHSEQPCNKQKLHHRVRWGLKSHKITLVDRVKPPKCSFVHKSKSLKSHLGITALSVDQHKSSTIRVPVKKVSCDRNFCLMINTQIDSSWHMSEQQIDYTDKIMWYKEFSVLSVKADTPLSRWPPDIHNLVLMHHVPVVRMGSWMFSRHAKYNASHNQCSSDFAVWPIIGYTDLPLSKVNLQVPRELVRTAYDPKSNRNFS